VGLFPKKLCSKAGKEIQDATRLFNHLQERFQGSVGDVGINVIQLPGRKMVRTSVRSFEISMERLFRKYPLINKNAEGCVILCSTLLQEV
jgi:hypothetical protein